MQPRLFQGVEDFYNELIALLPNAGIDREQFRKRLSALISGLDISLSSLSHSINYDSSFISRIISGQRNPSDFESFASAVSDYAASLCRNQDMLMNLYSVIEFSERGSEMLMPSRQKLSAQIKAYLLASPVDDKAADSVDNPNIYEFIKKIDEFNLNDYIRITHFDKLIVPTVSFHLPSSKRYFGEEGMKNAELDFLKTAALMPSGANIYMYSDMPMDSLAKDSNFSNKYIFGMAMILKKGQRIHQIHELNRPASEMMEGLIGWIPLYMTGQIVPYYMPDADNGFSMMIRYTDSVAMWGECTGKDLSTASFYITKNKRELQIYKGRRDHIFNQACSLMDIYTKERDNELYSFLQAKARSQSIGGFVRLLSAPPMHTMTPALLKKITSDNSAEKINSMINYLQLQKTLLADCVAHSTITEYFPIYSKEEFETHPVTLSLSGMFTDKDVVYDYDSYLEHIELTKLAAQKTDKYNISIENRYPFRNIQITTDGESWAMVSKNTVPAIHFVIHHPVLVKAIAGLCE